MNPIQCSVCASAEKKMMSRAGNSASSNETTTVRRPRSLSLAAGIRPKLGLHGSEVHLHSANPLWSCCLFGENLLQPYSPGLQVVKEGQNKPYMLPESLEGCRKALAKAFAWLSWPVTQGLISWGPWDFFSFSSWSYAYCWALAPFRNGLCSPYSLWICAISIFSFHFKAQYQHTDCKWTGTHQCHRQRVFLYKIKSFTLNNL